MDDFLSADKRFMGLEDSQAKPADAGVVITCIPFEKTSSYGRGSADGPAAILEASHQVELYDTDLGCEPWEVVGGIVTARPMPIGEREDGAAVAQRLEQEVGHWIEQGKTVVTLAGEHTGVVGGVLAHTRRVGHLTVLQIDAHSDMRPSYLDDPWNHACAMARVIDHHRDIVQVGIRSEAREDAVLVKQHNIPVFYGEQIQRDAARNLDWIAPVIDRCAENVYITIDCDGLDPSVIPTTGTPEPGGLTWLQINELLRQLCDNRRVVGFDLCELAPVPYLHHPQFIAAKLVYRLIGRIGMSRSG